VKTLWFVVPVHGRLKLADICLRQLRRTCDQLRENNVNATAVVVSDDATLKIVRPQDLGFGWVRRDNRFTSRRFNDGIQLATDPKHNPHPADYVVPFGSDDWADHRLFTEPLPLPHEIHGFRWMSFVREDGGEISQTYLNYEGGSGIRIIPRELIAPLSYRPCDEDRKRGCDTSILVNLRRHHGEGVKVKHWETPPQWIVDWKSSDQQLNGYKNVMGLHQATPVSDPFNALADHYPQDALDDMRAYYKAAA